MNLRKIFDKYNDDFLKFERVENKRCQRPDLHGFLLLNEICPGEHDLIENAGHDEIFFGIDINDFKNKVTEEQILELVRCGIRYDSGYESLTKFV